MVVEVLYSDAVKTLASILVVPSLVLILTLGLVWLLKVLTEGRPDVELLERFKLARYESGNPAKGEARRVLSMQYFGYLILFLALEPALILVALALLTSPGNLWSLIVIYLFLLLVFTPLIAYGVRESRRVESWNLE